MDTLSYDKNYIVLEGFLKVRKELTFTFLGNGIAIVPVAKAQKENNYPLEVIREGDVITIKDADLIDILQYLEVPSKIEFFQVENGYVANLESDF